MKSEQELTMSIDVDRRWGTQLFELGFLLIRLDEGIQT